jgi:uroporphyrinogen-III decarboxylase
VTPRERWLAALDAKPVDRLLFWPKLDGAYPRAQSGTFASMTNREIHDWIGSDLHDWLADVARAKRSRTSTTTARENGSRRVTFETPSGALERRDRFDEASQSWHPVSFPVRTLEDVKVLTAFHEDEDWELDREALEKARARKAEIGERAAMSTGIDISPFMRWIEWIAGIERGHFILADHPAEVEALFDAIHNSMLKRTRIIASHSPADMVYLSENTSTTLHSPAQYRKYCLPHKAAYSTILAEAGKRLVLHMCGKLLDILPDIAKVGARAYEAFTSPPVGNTRLADGRAACPDVCLIGGTNAALWIRSTDEIIAEVERDLDALPHHRGIVVTSAGVMPPSATPEKIRAVCEFVKAYPART